MLGLLLFLFFGDLLLSSTSWLSTVGGSVELDKENQIGQVQGKG